jgi:hypothetical protein
LIWREVFDGALVLNQTVALLPQCGVVDDVEHHRWLVASNGADDLVLVELDRHANRVPKMVRCSRAKCKSTCIQMSLDSMLIRTSE